MTRPAEIIFERGGYYIIRAPKKGFEVYRNESTHARRCASIGFEGQAGLDRAIAEIDRRMAATS